MRNSRWLLMGLVVVLAVTVAGIYRIPAAQASPRGMPLAQCPQLVVDGGFETGTGWTLGPSAAMPYYQSFAVHSGARALALGIPAGGNVKSFSSARQTVTIPASATTPLLNFWFFAIADSAPTTDYMEFVVLDPAGNILGKPWFSHNDSQVWNQMTVNMSAWRGQTIQLYFNVYNDGLGGRAAMFLDDVSLTACGGATAVPPIITVPAPTATLTPPVVLPTATLTPGVSCLQLVQNGNFSSLLSGWEAEGNLAGVGIASAPEPVRSPLYSLRLGTTGAVINGLSTARQMITLPPNYTQATIEAWVFPQSQINAGADYQELAILNSSGVVIDAPWRVVGSTGAWTRLAFTLNQYIGQTIFIRFGVFNDGQGGQTALYVDDVSVQVCNPVNPIVTVTPTATWIVPTAGPSPTWVPPPTWAPPPTFVPPAPGCVEITQNPSFEYGLYPWQPGQGNRLPARLVNAPVLNGAWAVQLGTVNGQNLNTYSSIRQWVTVPWGYPQKVVSFFAFTVAESFAGPDQQKFVILGPGDAVLAVPWQTLENAQTWQHFVFDISSVTSNQFALYFAAVNDGKGGRTALFVDEVHAYACTPGAVWPVPYQAPVGAQTFGAAAAQPMKAVPQAEPTYPFADTPAIDLPAGQQDGTLAPGLTAVPEPVVIEASPRARGVEGAQPLPTRSATEIAIEGAPTPLPAQAATPPAEQLSRQPEAEATPTGSAVVSPVPGLPTPEISVEVNTPARAPGFLTRAGEWFADVTADWPQGARTLVTILIGVVILLVGISIISWLIRRLRG